MDAYTTSSSSLSYVRVVGFVLEAVAETHTMVVCVEAVAERGADERGCATECRGDEGSCAPTVYDLGHTPNISVAAYISRWV
eukprot:gene45198-13254_t